MKIRNQIKPPNKALLISYQTNNRLSRNGAYQAVAKYAKKLGFHNPDSEKLEDHFGPHCCRHWFTTWLRRNEMPRDYIKELRGDSRKEAIDIYNHIDKQDLKKIPSMHTKSWDLILTQTHSKEFLFFMKDHCPKNDQKVT